MPFIESKWPNDLENQGPWPPFSITSGRIPGCIFGANSVILAQIYCNLSLRQAKFPRILSHNGQNDLEDQGPGPPFQLSIPGCMFGANLVMVAQICDRLSCGQAEFPRFWVKRQNELEGHGQWPHFQYQLKVSCDACVVQIWWFQLQSVTSYRADKVKFTDRQTVRRRQRQYPLGLIGQGEKGCRSCSGPKYAVLHKHLYYRLSIWPSLYDMILRSETQHQR